MFNKHHSEETKRKMKLHHKGFDGRHHSKETKRKIGLIHKGKIVSEETRKKMSLARKGKSTWMKGRHHSEATKRKISLSEKGKQKTEEHRNNISLGLRGEKCRFWKGGISQGYLRRLSERKWNRIRREVYKRDKYTCRECGVKYHDINGNSLHAHHIIPYQVSRDDSLGNLITLCLSCHRKEEHKARNQ